MKLLEMRILLYIMVDCLIITTVAFIERLSRQTRNLMHELHYENVT